MDAHRSLAPVPENDGNRHTPALNYVVYRISLHRFKKKKQHIRGATADVSMDAVC